jgi:hypothetical protein
MALFHYGDNCGLWISAKSVPFCLWPGNRISAAPARLLNLSQPALTKRMRRLEEDLGGPLLVRGRHGAQLI